jgi:hypothetical protein
MSTAWFPLHDHGAVAPEPPTVRVPWERSRLVLALALHQCTHCRGSGVSDPFVKHPRPCRCVLRRIFVICHNRYQLIGSEQMAEGTSSHFMMTGNPRAIGKRRARGWSRPKEEFRADFVCIARRALTADEFHLFVEHFLELRAWPVCATRLQMTRGNFYHAVYRVQAKVGEAFAATEPFALFPLDEYLGGTGHGRRSMGEDVNVQPKVLRKISERPKMRSFDPGVKELRPQPKVMAMGAAAA